MEIMFDDLTPDAQERLLIEAVSQNQKR